MPSPEFSTPRSRNEIVMTHKKDRELDEEIRSHLDMSVRDRVERGESRDVAEAAARREFGNVALVKEVTREMSGWMWLERVFQDLRYAARMLWRSPGFTLVAILSLSLGIGANTAIFQVINAVGLRTLPVDDPGTLAYIRIADLEGARGSFNSRFPAVTNPIWEELERTQQAFSRVMAWGGATFNLAPGGLARPARGLWVSGQFFETLGVSAAAGRLFTDADDRRGCAPRAVISHAFWQSELGGRPAVGATLSLDGHPVEIVGVTAPAFTGVVVGRGFDVAVPICAEPALSDGKGRLDAGTDWWLVVMGRLKQGWTLDQASAHLASISPGLFRTTLPPTYPTINVNHYLGFKLKAVPGGAGVSGLREDYAQPLWLLLGAAGLVLVIACVNLANLLLARASARQREFAIRLGLGASRGRIIRQLLVESLLLAAIGALFGSCAGGHLESLARVVPRHRWADDCTRSRDRLARARLHRGGGDADVRALRARPVVTRGACERDGARPQPGPRPDGWPRTPGAPPGAGHAADCAFSAAARGRAALYPHAHEPARCRSRLRAGWRHRHGARS